MRRLEREITDLARITRFLDEAIVCRLALCQDNIPYVVPMNYGYEFSGNTLTLYFHSAKEGKKIDMLKANPLAAFEIDLSLDLIKSDVACKHSIKYESVIGIGDVTFCEDPEEKRKALTLFMAHYVPEKTFPFRDEELQNICIFKLTASEYTAKSNR